MVEYTVVLVFGVLSLTTGPGGDAVLQLLNVIKQNYQGYSYGLSMSEPPDFDSAEDLVQALEAQGLEDEEIERLAIDTPDALKVLQFFNRDPMDVLDDVKDIADPTNALPQNAGDVLDGAGSFF